MKNIICGIFLAISALTVYSQPGVSIDGVIAVIGKDIIMKSDLEAAYAEYTSQFAVVDNREEIKCEVLSHLVLKKLMLHQAALDSIMITDQQVEDQLNYRFSYLISQVGGDVKRIEEFYKKSIADIKKDMRVMMKEQLTVDEVQRSITDRILITPSEVKQFYEKIPYDSLPMIPASYEFGHIVKIPPVSEEEIAAIKKRLNDYRERVQRGESFSMLARMYSDDPGSAPKGGGLGFVERGTLYPEFEAVAFSLKSGEVSGVVQTKAGYHIIQMIERRGEMISVAHILLQPKPSTDEQVKAIEYLDSIRDVIIASKIDFSDAANKFSDDLNKNNGGWVVNPYTNTYKFDKESMEQTTYAIVDKLIPNEYSQTIPYVNEDGNMAYRILYMKSKTAAHKPNLVEDYDMIKNAAIEEKKGAVIDKWILNKVKVTSIKIADNYKNCSFITEWQIP